MRKPFCSIFRRPAVFVPALLGLAVSVIVSAQTNTPAAKPEFKPSQSLDQWVNSAVDAATAQFGPGGLTPDKIAITVIDMRDRRHPAWANHRGEAATYPASVVKLFYLVAAHHQMDSGQLQDTPELDRALRDMIVDSSNDATHYVLNVLSGTSDGPELDAAALKDFMNKRNVVNRYFASLGYEHINADQKTWCEGPYGREKQALGPHNENRNMLTTDATARLMYEIAAGQAVTPARSQAMLDLLRRDPTAPSDDPDDQATAFSGKALPPGAQLYSKAGWTTSTRHDAAYIRLPNGAEYVLVTFTVDNSAQTGIIPFVSKFFVQKFMPAPASSEKMKIGFLDSHRGNLGL